MGVDTVSTGNRFWEISLLMSSVEEPIPRDIPPLTRESGTRQPVRSTRHIFFIKRRLMGLQGIFL